MEVQASRSSSSAAHRRWVMLQGTCTRTDDADLPYSMGDIRTLATAFTSAGYPVQVSLRLADPPAASCVCLHLPDGDGDDDVYPSIVAAHRDSLLIRIIRLENLVGFGWFEEDDEHATPDYFVYNAGAGGAADAPRPPSLWLLPPCYIAKESSGPHRSRLALRHATGLIRGGEDDELVVAELRLLTDKASTDGQRPDGTFRLVPSENLQVR
nr:unnamed protein product [Digitaria exilis]